MHTSRRRTIRTAVLAIAAATAVAVPAVAVRGAGGATAKHELLQVFAARRAAAAGAPKAPKDPGTRPRASSAEPAWPRGIIESGQAPYPGSVFAFVNQWHDIVGGEHASAYAGAYRDDPSQGIVALDFTALDGSGPASAGGVYPTPVKAGAVRIVSAANGVLTLIAADGTRFTFDVGTRGFAVR